ncbi:MAG: HRDC domain-containing protein [Clostridia bacterium]|nr:HRDC domain-containing protein [Clostridia bacterium]
MIDPGGNMDKFTVLRGHFGYTSFLELLEVSGVGQIKAQRYGEQFLEVIEAYLNSVEEL